MLNRNSKIYIAGHQGMVGSSFLRLLKSKGYHNIMYKTLSELDLRNQKMVEQFFKINKPDVVINAAAKVGGILANNNYPYDFLLDNMLIQNNLIRSALESKTKNFIFLGSSCIYPKFAPQPISETDLLTSELEPTNQWYAIAKISGVKLIEAIRKQFNMNYISLMPTNLYGINDNFDLETSHVLPAMIRKFHDAKLNGLGEVTLWGTGSPLREFLNVDDLSNAIFHALSNNLTHHLFNVGSNEEISIKDLADLIKNIIGYKGEIVWDNSKPDGTPRKLMNSSRFISTGWKPSISLRNGIKDTYKWYLENIDTTRKVKFNN